MTELAIPVSPRAGVVDRLRDYVQLSKGRIVAMVLITTAAGYLMAAPAVDPLLLMHTLIGTALVAAGTNALNQYAERELDGKMLRTRRRPIPGGRMAPRTALVFAAGVAIVGTAYLAVAVNWLASALGAITLVTYIFVYTPLKRVSTLCTIVGAVPGAIPPLMGWVAARGELGAGGWIAFAILFLWQMPHFMAISWMYRDDYARAGFAMLSVRDGDGRATARQAIYFSIALLAASVLPVAIGMAGVVYLAAAVIAGSVILFCSIRFYFDTSGRMAARLFMVSNAYLVTVMLLLVIAARASIANASSP